MDAESVELIEKQSRNMKDPTSEMTSRWLVRGNEPDWKNRMSILGTPGSVANCRFERVEFKTSKLTLLWGGEVSGLLQL